MPEKKIGLYRKTVNLLHIPRFPKSGLTGAVRLIQDYKMPLTLGNECSGIVEQTGKLVTMFKPGARVYSRLPVSSLGAFAEYVAVPGLAAARMPEELDFVTAAVGENYSDC